MRKVFIILRCVLSNTLDVVVMKRYTSVIGSHTGLWTMMLGAGVLAVLMLAGATGIVDDDSGAGYADAVTEVGTRVNIFDALEED